MDAKGPQKGSPDDLGLGPRGQGEHFTVSGLAPIKPVQKDIMIFVNML